VYEETLTGRPHDSSVQKATSDNENVDAVSRHAQDSRKRFNSLEQMLMMLLDSIPRAGKLDSGPSVRGR